MCICNSGVITEWDGSVVIFKSCTYCEGEREDGLKKLKERLDAFNSKKEVVNS